MKHFQVLSAGKPIFFFEIEEPYADNEPSDRNTELVNSLAGVLKVADQGPNFVPQLITKIPLVLADQDPDFKQEELRAWVSPKLRKRR